MPARGPPRPPSASVSLRTSLAIFTTALCPRNLRRRHEHAPGRHVNRIRDGQPRVAVNPRAGIPAAVLAFVAHAHGEDVLLARRFQVGREVVFETRVAVGMVAEQVAVDPHVRVHVNAVEPHRDALAGVRRCQREVLCDTSPMPPTTCPVECAALAVAGVERPDALRRILLRRQILDAPVVRQIERPPGFVVEARSFGAGSVRAQETPAGVEGTVAVDGGGVRGERAETTTQPEWWTPRASRNDGGSVS